MSDLHSNKKKLIQFELKQKQSPSLVHDKSNKDSEFILLLFFNFKPLASPTAIATAILHFRPISLIFISVFTKYWVLEELPELKQETAKKNDLMFL